MHIGTVLLSQDNFYLDDTGQLPKRPLGDKEFLINLCKDQICVGSSNTLNDLPSSIYKIAHMVVLGDLGNDIFIEAYQGTKNIINLGIKTFKLIPPDIMIITRSQEHCIDGKAFDINWLMDNYKRIVKDNIFEIWTRN